MVEKAKEKAKLTVPEVQGLQNLGVLRNQFQTAATGVALPAEAEAPTEGDYVAQARARYTEMDQHGRALLDLNKTDDLEKLFPGVRDHLLNQLRAGKQEFKDMFHNGLVRNTDGRFLRAFFAYIEKDLAGAAEGTPEWTLAVQAKEFTANRIRREAFGTIKGIDKDEAKADEAKRMFHDVLQKWEKVGDNRSIARVYYEFGQIADEEKNLGESADWQIKSAELCDKTGDTVGTLIARVKAAEAWAKQAEIQQDQATLNRLVPEIERLFRDLTTLTKTEQYKDDQNLQNWVHNALRHWAQISTMAKNWSKTIEACGLYDKDPYLTAHQGENWALEAEKERLEFLRQTNEGK